MGIRTIWYLGRDVCANANSFILAGTQRSTTTKRTRRIGSDWCGAVNGSGSWTREAEAGKGRFGSPGAAWSLQVVDLRLMEKIF